MTKILNNLNQLLKNNFDNIESWLENEYKNYPPSFYSSVDIRHSGNKIVPVDTNLFPAGFNNFDGYSQNIASLYTREFISTNYPNIKNILLITENHTRNNFYLKNIDVLKTIITNAGYNLELALLDDNIFNSQPDLIILNNDLTAGIPEILSNLKIPIIPSTNLGWHKRSKFNHFTQYKILIEKFCKEFDLNSLLFSSSFQKSENINFKEKTDIENLALQVDDLISSLKTIYEKNNIKEEPYVFIKANQGTYGMGIMIAKNANDVLNMNKKTRNKMNMLKNGIQNTSLLIQEGIKTIDKIDEYSAEPLIYLVNSKPIGITFRSHKTKDAFSSLNSSGMEFKKINSPYKEYKEYMTANDYAGFFLIAQLATIAASMENS